MSPYRCVIGLSFPVLLVVSTSCASQPAAVDSARTDDSQVVAAVEQILDNVSASAASTNAEGVLAAAPKDDTFTFITGDTMLTGYDDTLHAFRETYALLQGQTNQVLHKRTRVLSPDVVLVATISEGDYTDKTGFKSPPVGLGTTAVFVRNGADWRLVHYHQSVAK